MDGNTVNPIQLSDVFRSIGEQAFHTLVRTISVSRLKTYQLYGTLKARAGAPKLNVEWLRRLAPRFWQRIQDGDEELAGELAQAILVSNLDMVIDVLNFLGIPHRDGFFEKDLDVTGLLQGDWQARAFEHFRSKYPEPLLIFYLNHLAREVSRAEEVFLPKGEA